VSALYRGTFRPQQFGNLPSRIPAQIFSVALIDLIGTETQDTSSQTTNVSYGVSEDWPSVARPRASVNGGLPANTSLKQSLLPLLADAGDSGERHARTLRIGMTLQLKKRRSRIDAKILFLFVAVAFIIATAINADGLNIANYLATAKAEQSFWINSAREEQSMGLPVPVQTVRDHMEAVSAIYSILKGSAPQGRGWGRFRRIRHILRLSIDGAFLSP
jgi:hypothetical protein